MKVSWTPTSEVTFEEEIEFIRRKWNEEQVDEFTDLVFAFVKILSSGILIGKPYEGIEGVRVSVISRQTSLVYKWFEEEERIDLMLFWNNKKDPAEFEKFLRT